jgi:guanylate kinase
MSSTPGKLIILSGPSGAGKSTVLRRVLAHFPRTLRLSISATTRAPRLGERDGIDYFFLTPEEFAKRLKAGEFLEACEVFGRGHWYGTLLEQVTPSLQAGVSVILEIDVDGTDAALQHYPNAVTIFLTPNSLDEVERRLKSRATETPEAIDRRLEVARHELSLAGKYKHQVLNDDVDAAEAGMIEVLKSEGLTE